ncbi:MAG: hypothetical protein CMQ54_02130 [Gammaproteobacteria bacterium]|nr:hypothetical protein [Gammaproteobacteria bacterium]
MTHKSLKGIGVLITRPKKSANGLIEAIESEGGNVFNFPVINIVPRGKNLVAAEEAKLPNPDITIFISRNAVQEGLQYARKSLIGAIGPSTSAAIKNNAQNVDIEPTKGFDSENLLKEADLQNISGKRIRIIRGNKGRKLLGRTLQDRGAIVHYLSVYERKLPDINKAILERIETAMRKKQIHIVTAMSAQTYRNIFLLFPKKYLKDIGSLPLVTPAVRVIKEAKKNYPHSKYFLSDSIDIPKVIDAIILASKLKTKI